MYITVLHTNTKDRAIFTTIAETAKYIGIPLASVRPRVKYHGFEIDSIALHDDPIIAANHTVSGKITL